MAEFVVFGETVIGELGEQQIVADGDLKRARAAALDRHLGAVGLFEQASRTERPGLIVSLYAVFDMNLDRFAHRDLFSNHVVYLTILGRHLLPSVMVRRNRHRPTPPPGHPEDAAMGGRVGEWAGDVIRAKKL